MLHSAWGLKEPQCGKCTEFVCRSTVPVSSCRDHSGRYQESLCFNQFIRHFNKFEITSRLLGVCDQLFSRRTHFMLLSKGNVHCGIHKCLFWTLVNAIRCTHLPTAVLEVGGGYWDDKPPGKCFEWKILTMTN